MIRRRLGALVAVLAVCAGSTLLGAPTATAEDEPTTLFTMSDERIAESSGLARSIKHKNIWWTINDSGDEARIFAVDETGEVQAVLTFGAEVRDVEAIAVGDNGRIYVADIGDNLRDQKKVRVYSVTEPSNLRDQEMRYRTYDFSYPDGPHNSEAMLLHPKNHRLYFVTKELKGVIYAAPEELSTERTNKLTKAGAAPAIVTDGTFTPDGKRIILRDPTAMTVLTWPGPKTFARTSLPVQPLGESIAMGPTDASVLAGSEGKNSAVYQVTIPTKKSGPSPSATPTPTPAAGKDSGKDAGAGQSHTLRWTLIGAGAFALVIAMMTFPAGRRERLDAMMESQRTRSTT